MSRSSGDRKPRVKAPAESRSGEVLLPGSQVAVLTWQKGPGALGHVFYRGTDPIHEDSACDLGPPKLSHFGLGVSI